MKKFRHTSIIYLVSLLLSFFISSEAMAMNEFDEDRDVKLTIEYNHEDIVISGARFDMYKVGNIDKNGNIDLLDEFKEYSVDFTKINQKEWNNYALTLTGYVQSENKKPFKSGKTNFDGNLEIYLKSGLYLIVGEQTTIGDFKYKSNPYFVFLPEYEKETGKWDYEITSLPKTTKETVTDKKINKKVIKVWKDEKFEKERPNNIEIELLADGELFETIILNKDNNWRYKWDNLDSNKDWTVAEKKLDKNKYDVKITEEENVFIVENTYKPKEPPKIPRQTLPQTGQMWWPAYLFIGVGSLFMIVGFIKKQERKRKEDE